MSDRVVDENDDSYRDSLTSIASQHDSGYCTFNSSCQPSPCRLSPSVAVLHQLDSPGSDHDSQSPRQLPHRKFLSPLDYDNYRNTRKHFDILTQLSYRNAGHLVDAILEHLPASDIRSCLHVCRKWQSIVDDFSRRRQAKTVKRNLFHHEPPAREPKKFTSTPMHAITNVIHSKISIPLHIEPAEAKNVSISSSTADANTSLTASALSFRYGYLKYLHGPTVPKRCPLCAFVSIVDVNDQHGVCTNPLCRNSFCQCCSGPYHASSPCKTSTGPIRSPWRKRVSISPIFSNKTRSNLRRLLLR